MITSTSNSRIKEIRKLQTDRRTREQERLFVAEGDRWLQELQRTGTRPHLILTTPSWLADPAHATLLAQLDAPHLPVTDAVMASASDTQTPPGVLAVIPQPDWPLPANPSLLLVLDEVQNPGNLGTLLRTAAAAGVSAVLLSPGCVDAYNPKTVRGSMGAHLRLPVLRQSWEQIAAALQALSVWVASVEPPATPYTQVNWQEPTALIIGSEAHGAGDKAHKLARGRVTIPMHAATESLNAAVAAAVILFEAQRQRQTERERMPN
jgi:TrmH family RNA methyltransferase